MKAAKKKRFRPGFGYLACQLAPAPSESERLVLVDRLDGGRTSAIVNSQEVRPSDPLRGPIPGEVIVTVVGKGPRKNNFIVSGATHTSHLAPRSFTSLAG